MGDRALRLVEELTRGDWDAARTPELMEALDDPRVMRRVERYVRLNEMRVRLLLAQYRPTLASRLVQLAMDERVSNETARKACNDALRLHDPPPIEEDENPLAALALVIGVDPNGAEEKEDPAGE